MAIEDADDLAGFFSDDEFATTASWRASGVGAARDVVGIFESGYAAAGLGGLGVEGREITFRCAVSSLEEAAQGDSLVIGGVTYRVRSVRPDGTGVLVLVLGT